MIIGDLVASFDGFVCHAASNADSAGPFSFFGARPRSATDEDSALAVDGMAASRISARIEPTSRGPILQRIFRTRIHHKDTKITKITKKTMRSFHALDFFVLFVSLW